MLHEWSTYYFISLANLENKTFFSGKDPGINHVQKRCKWGKGTTLVYENYFYTEWHGEADSTIARMLFDHSTDPEENKNLAIEPNQLELVNNLSSMQSEINYKTT